MKQILGIILSITLSAGSFAQSPNKMSYQSVVRNSNGQLVTNSTITVRISILQGSANGNIAYMETHTKISNENGLVSLEIGGGTVALGTFSGINWANGPYFIKTETDPAGGSNYTIQGTSQLMSVPFALYAEKSGNSSDWIKDSKGIYYNAGKVGIGTPNSDPNLSTAILSVNGAIDQYSDNTFQTVSRIRNSSSNQEYQINVGGSNNIDFAPKSIGIYNASNLNWLWNSDGTSSYLAIGSYDYKQKTPKSRLHVFNGDININDIGKGIIMKSPNGQCWRVTVSDTGTFVSTSITCP